MDSEPDASELIDRRLASLGDWRGAMLGRLRDIIRAADAEILETVKWRKPSNNMLGVPVWESEGIICTGEIYKNYVKLTFATGAALDDPEGLFNASLEGNVRRAIDFTEGAEVNASGLDALVKQAVTRNRVTSAAKPKRKAAK